MKCPERNAEESRKSRTPTDLMGASGKIHFDGFTLDLERHALYRGQQRIHLTPKPLATLIHLVESRGHTVEKQKLLDAVWKDTFVTEDTLVHAIREIRRALGDDKANPRFVQTVPREGYRFVCEICTADEIELSALKDQELLPTSPPLVEPRRKTTRRLWLAAPVLAFALALVWFFRPHEGRTSHESRPNGIFKQITTGEFPSGKPVFSPDGKFILYVSSSEGTRGYGDLFVRQFPDGNAQRITNRLNPGGDLPAFTSDGSHAVFAMPKVDQDGARHHDLWIVPSFGGSPKRLVEDASGAGFSPDGKWVAYTKHLSSGNALWLSPVAALQEHIDVKAGGYSPRWSHNGELLAYTTSDPNGGDGDLWICRISESRDGPAVSDQRQITTDQKQIYGLTWTIDDRSIIFGSKRTGSAQLHEVSIADRTITSFLLGVGEYEAPSAAPDGRTVIFHNKRVLNDLKITTLSAGCESKAVTYGEFRLWPRFSSSGERLVTVLRQVDNTERLYLTDLRTKESSQLSEREARHPCWLDEENIAFLSSDASSKDTEVLVVNTVTRETRSLTLFSGDANWLAIHPDGKRLAVAMRSSDGKERILLRDLSNAVDQTIQEGAEYEYLRWSPDGSALCWDKPGVSRNAPQLSGGIWLLEAGQAQPRLIANDGYCPVWSQNGTAIYFTTRSGEQALWRYDLTQKRVHKVCDWGTVYSFDIAGSRVAFSELRNDTQIYSVSIE